MYCYWSLSRMNLMIQPKCAPACHFLLGHTAGRNTEVHAFFDVENQFLEPSLKQLLILIPFLREAE